MRADDAQALASVDVPDAEGAVFASAQDASVGARQDEGNPIRVALELLDGAAGLEVPELLVQVGCLGSIGVGRKDSVRVGMGWVGWGWADPARVTKMGMERVRASESIMVVHVAWP